MKKFIITLILGLSCCFISNTAEVGGDAESTMVYICTGSSSARYHSHKSCRGLSNCGGSIKEISLEEAQRMGRTPCRICYR